MKGTNCMELQIIKAIVHVLDSAAGAPVFSDELLQLGGEEQDYLAAHLQKAWSNDSQKRCAFQPESAFVALLTQSQDFTQCSKQIAQMFFDQMRQYPAIPSADLFVVFCSVDGREHAAVLKMNYKTAYVHHYQQVEGRHCNALLKQRTILPPAGAKCDESVFVDMATGEVRLVEKKYELDGAKDLYLSTRVLQSTQAQPERVKLQTVQQAARQAVKENYQQDQSPESEVAALLCEETAAAGGQLDVQRVKQRLEQQFPLAVQDFTQELEQSGLSLAEQVQVPPARIKRMEYQTVKTESGIELRIPVSLLAAKNEYVEFINDADGTISLLLKGVVL